MALVDCKSCGQKISEFAKICPKCNCASNVEKESIDNIVKPVVTNSTISDSETPILSKETAQQTKNNETNKTNPPVEKRNKIIRILLFVLVGFIILAILYFVGGFDRNINTNQIPTQNPNSSNSENESDTYSEEETVDNNDENKSDKNENDKIEKEDEKSIEQLEYEEDNMWNDPTPNFVEENLSSFINVDLDYKQKLIKGIENVRVSVRNDTKYTLDFVRIELIYSKLNNDIFATEDLYFTSIGPFSTITMSGPSKDIGAFVQYNVIEGEVSK